jgi:hypothetical protein
MRFALVRGWAVAATAIVAGAIADAGTEFAENSGWLAGTLRDDQHQAILPALLLGTALTLGLILFVLLARISPRDPLLIRMDDLRTRFIDIASAFCGSMLCVVVMEGYETRFGGLSPFDPRSVVLSHTLALIVAFVVTGTVVYCALRSALRTASRASSAVVEFLAEFLRKLFGMTAAHRAPALSAYELDVLHVPFAIARGSCGFRAPPRSIRPHRLSA